jgi:hypothetical protein
MHQSYRLIGVDRNGNKTTLEQRAISSRAAAELLHKENPRFIRFLDGSTVARGNSFPGKTVYEIKGMSSDAINSILGDSLAQAQRVNGLDTARMIIREIERKKYRLVCIPGDKSTEVRAIARPDEQVDPLTDQDRQDIVEHQESIIAVLAERQADEPEPVKKKTARKKTASEIPPLAVDDRVLVQSILTELSPDRAFQSYDFEQRLLKRGLQEIADDSTRVMNMLEGAVKEGLLTSKRAGSYRIPSTEQPPQPQMDLAPTIIPPVALPEPPATPVIEKEVSTIVQPTQPLARAIEPSDIGFHRLLESLVSTAIAQQVTSQSIAEQLEAALGQYQDYVLEATTRLEITIKPLIQRIRMEEQLRTALRDQIIPCRSP